MTTPSPTLDVEQRLRAALVARAEQISADRLCPAAVPSQPSRPWRSRAALVAAGLAVVGAGGYALAGGDGPESRDLHVVDSPADGTRLAGVTYELPPGWEAVEQDETRPMLRRACLQPAGLAAEGGCPALELLVADPVPGDDYGGAVRVEYLGTEDCAFGATKIWNIDETTIDGAAAHSNVFQCEADDVGRVFWTLDGFNLALLVNDPRWEQTAETIVTSLRISPDLRQSSLGVHYVEATPYDPEEDQSPPGPVDTSTVAPTQGP